MAFGIKHAGLATIISLGASTPIGLGAAGMLSFLLHWPLDDLNVGKVAQLFHRVEESEFKWFIYGFRALCWFGLIVWIAFIAENKLYPTVCIVASIILDLDHIIPFRRGWLHSKMWPSWLHTEWGMIPIIIAMISMFLILWF